MNNEKLERFMAFTIADCVEIASIVGYVKFMEVFHKALLTKKNTTPLSQEELDEKQKQLWNDWKY
jgi:hypothetical protein